MGGPKLAGPIFWGAKVNGSNMVAGPMCGRSNVVAGPIWPGSIVSGSNVRTWQMSPGPMAYRVLCCGSNVSGSNVYGAYHRRV